MLKLYHASLNSISSEEVLKLLKFRNRNEKHIIITPDRANLNYEKKLFSITGESSFFDVTITTLSRFCNSIIAKFGQESKVLSKMSGVAIVKKILLEHRKEFKTFQKSVEFKNFAEDIFNLLCMFKSNNVVPKDAMGENISPKLQGKLHDLNLIYEKYEEFLQNDFTDSFNRLNLCRELINVGDFKDVNMYFLGFDDFTKQGYNVIEKLLKCAKNVYISTTFAKKMFSKRNSVIYLNNVYYEMLDIAKNSNTPFEIFECDNELCRDICHLSNNAFALKPDNYNGEVEHICINEFLTFTDELKGVISDIKFKVINGERYKNFAIMIPQLSEKKKAVIDMLRKYNIPYFIDVNTPLKDSVVSKFLLNLVGFKIRINKDDVLNILKSPFCNIDRDEISEYENHIIKFGLNDKALINTEFNGINSYFDLFGDFLNKKCVNVDEYVECLVSLLEKIEFDKSLERLIKIYFDNNDILEYKKLNNVASKISNIFTEMKNVLGSVECNAKLFLEIFSNFLESSNVAMPPILSDSVFVGDVSSSFIDKYDYVYVLNVNEGQILNVASDDGIITDGDIDSISNQIRINPTVRFVNKKNKFKLFELLFSSRRCLTLSYHVKNGGGECFASAFLLDIAKFMNIKINKASLHFNEIENNLLSLNSNNIIKNNFCKRSAYENFLSNLRLYDAYRTNKNYIKLISTVYDSLDDESVIDNMFFKNKYETLNDGNFFPNNKVSVSRFENYFRCPYMHFVNYSLRLKDQESEDVKAFEIGNIIHEFLKEAVPVLIGEKYEIDKLVNDLLSKILSNKDYAHFASNRANNFIIKDLYEECKRICKVVVHMNLHSKFKPVFYEKPFISDENDGCNLCDGKIQLVGVIDRIDKCGDKFIVIDYKTGSSSFSDFSEVYYGKKLQLIVYLMVFSDKNNLVPAGAFYLPISNGFSKTDGKELYKMKGVMNIDNANFTMFDDRLSQCSFNSDIISAGTDKNGKIKQNNNFYKNLCLSSNDFSKLIEFVKGMLKRATNEIMRGIISPKPLMDGNKKECDYCKYKGMCNFNTMYSNEYVVMKKVPNVKTLIGEVEDE